MLIERLWPHLTTPFVYAVALLQLAAFVWFTDTQLALFLSLWMIALAYGLSNFRLSQPFHHERIVILFALVLSYLAIARLLPGLFFEQIHAHGDVATYAVYAIYNILWLVLAAGALVGFIRSPSRRAPMVWLAISLAAFILSLLPLEYAEAVEGTGGAAPWLLFLRSNISFFTFLVVSLGDAAYLTERFYSKLAHDGSASSDDIEVSLLRTLSWITLALLPFYVRSFLLVLSLLILALLLYVLVERWKLARHAKRAYVRGETPSRRDTFARPGRIPSSKKTTAELLASANIDDHTLRQILVQHGGAAALSVIDDSPPGTTAHRKHRRPRDNGGRNK